MTEPNCIDKPNYANKAPNTNYTDILVRVVKLGFPVALQSALVAVLSLADVLMVSDFGQQATAAVGIAAKWHFVAIMIIAGLASANGILVAQYWGKGDKKTAKTITVLTLKFGAKVLLPVSVIITVFATSIMMLQTNDHQVIELGATYLWYAFPVLLLTHIIIVLESALRSSGDTITPLILGTITITLNIILNFWLIKGGLGVPPLGVAGAALATTISRFVQVLLMVSFIYIRQHWLIQAEQLEKIDRLWRSYLKIALPTTASAVIWAMGTMAYQMIFGHLGTTQLAVFSMISPFESLCYSLFFGISVACSVLIGQSLGKNEFDQAAQMSSFFIKLVVVVGLLVGVSLFAAKPIVLQWLNLDSPQFLPLASPVLTIICMAIWLKMLNMVIINGILRAGGDNQFCLKMDIFSMWFIGVPVTAIGALVFQLEFQLVYLLLLLEESVKLTLCFWRYKQKHWLKNLTLSSSL